MKNLPKKCNRFGICKQKTILFFFVFFTSIVLFSQQKKIDSLKQVYKQTINLNDKLDLLNELNKIIINTGDAAKEEKMYFKEMLSVSDRLSKGDSKAQAAKYLSIFYLRKENLKESEKYALLSKEVSLIYKNNRALVKAYRQLGLLYNHFDKYEIAIENYKKAIDIFDNELEEEEKKEDERMPGIIFANLSTVYKNIHQDSLSIVYDLKSIEVANKTKDFMRESLFYTKIGWTYVFLEQYKIAETNFKRALRDSSKIYVKVYNISAHHGLGFNYLKWSKYDKSIYHDSIALNYFRKTDNKIFIQAVLNSLADAYIGKGQLKKAYELNKEASEIANEINSLKSIGKTILTFAEINLINNKYEEAEIRLKKLLNSKLRYKITNSNRLKLYDLLQKIYIKRKRYKRVCQYDILSKQLNDSITSRKLQNFSRIDLKYQIEKNKKELIQQKQIITQKELVKQKLITTLVVLFFISILSLYILFRYYKHNLQNRNRLNETIQEVKRMQKELFETKDQINKQTQAIDLKKFHSFLMIKYHIEKFEIIDVWVSIANGVSRAAYSEQRKISENTVKAWRKELYNILKKSSSTTNNRYNNYQAVIEYYNNLNWFKVHN